jgi:hypothetical protein
MTVMGGRQRCIRGREVESTSMTDESVKVVDSMFVKLGKEAVGRVCLKAQSKCEQKTFTPSYSSSSLHSLHILFNQNGEWRANGLIARASRVLLLLSSSYHSSPPPYLLLYEMH